MKKRDVNLKMLFIAVGLFFSFSVANAQSGNNDVLTAKQEYQKRGAPAVEQLQKNDVRSDEYRAQKEAFLKNGGALETKKDVVRPNSLVNTTVKGGLMEYDIQLGWDVKNADDAAAYESKIAGQKGVLKASVDHETNTVRIRVKEEDEWNVLSNLFDIENNVRKARK